MQFASETRKLPSSTKLSRIRSLSSAFYCPVLFTAQCFILPVICHMLFAIPNFSSKRIVLAASEVCRILACHLPLAIPNFFLLAAKAKLSPSSTKLSRIRSLSSAFYCPVLFTAQCFILPVICHMLFAIPNFSSKRIVLAASEVCRILACYLPLAIPNFFLPRRS